MTIEVFTWDIRVFYVEYFAHFFTLYVSSMLISSFPPTHLTDTLRSNQSAAPYLAVNRIIYSLGQILDDVVRMCVTFGKVFASMRRAHRKSLGAGGVAGFQARWCIFNDETYDSDDSRR